MKGQYAFEREEVANKMLKRKSRVLVISQRLLPDLCLTSLSSLTSSIRLEVAYALTQNNFFFNILINDNILRLRLIYMNLIDVLMSNFLLSFFT